MSKSNTFFFPARPLCLCTWLMWSFTAVRSGLHRDCSAGGNHPSVSNIGPVVLRGEQCCCESFVRTARAKSRRPSSWLWDWATAQIRDGPVHIFQFRSDADTQRLIQTQGFFFHFNIITFIVGVVFKVTSWSQNKPHSTSYWKSKRIYTNALNLNVVQRNIYIYVRLHLHRRKQQMERFHSNNILIRNWKKKTKMQPYLSLLLCWFTLLIAVLFFTISRLKYLQTICI